jgi:ATP-dependent Clp protease adaptor protein ClpS
MRRCWGISGRAANGPKNGANDPEQRSGGICRVQEFASSSNLLFLASCQTNHPYRFGMEEYMSQGEPLHCVFLMNDDFTPMEFVVHVLERSFDMDSETAKRTMLRIHNEGAWECGFYPRQEAEQKVAEVVAFAERHGHPLQCACEMGREISE